MFLEAMRGELEAVAIDPLDPNLRRYLIASMGSLKDERLRILFLDARHRLIADECLQDGTLAHLAVYPRTIFRRALELNAAGIILIHNHPSGDPTPSKEDEQATQHIDAIARSLDINLVDHIVVGACHTRHITSRDQIARQRSRTARVTLKSPIQETNDGSGVALENARATLRRRLLRRQLIGAEELFGEPAWEMLIDLFIHEGEGKPLSTSDLCVTSTIPMSSALRLVQKLCDAGLVDRTPDLMDARRSFVRLRPDTAHRLRAYFSDKPE
ncbi:JAB domain-containing protein [Sphingopyxis sp. LARHCG72]